MSLFFVALAVMAKAPAIPANAAPICLGTTRAVAKVLVGKVISGTKAKAAPTVARDWPPEFRRAIVDNDARLKARIVVTGCNRTMCKGFKKGSFSTQVMYLPCRCILDFMSVFVKFGIQRERAQWTQ